MVKNDLEEPWKDRAIKNINLSNLGGHSIFSPKVGPRNDVQSNIESMKLNLKRLKDFTKSPDVSLTGGDISTNRLNSNNISQDHSS